MIKLPLVFLSVTRAAMIMSIIVMMLVSTVMTFAAGSVSVAQCGALPNGAGDASVAIQQAVNFAHAHQKTTVKFKAGTYKISKTITLYRYNDICLAGAVKADGMPATIIQVQLADSYSPCFIPFNCIGCNNVATRNFVFTCCKPVDMVARVVAVGDKSVTIEPLPRYIDGCEPTHAAGDNNAPFNGFTLFDLQSSNSVTDGVWGRVETNAPFSWKRIAGTTCFQTEGLTETPPVFVGEYLTWNYQRMWNGAGANFIKCTNIAAVNLQGLHWPGGLGYGWLCSGKILFKDCYFIPQDGYYANGDTGGSGDAMGCGGAVVTLDHLVHITSHCDDSYDSPYYVYGVMEIVDPYTLIVQTGGDIAYGPGCDQIPNTELNEQVWIVADTPAGNPFRCRLEDKPQPIAPPGYAKTTRGWYRLRFAQALPAALLTPRNGSYVVFPRFCADQLWIKHCVDLRSNFGGWHISNQTMVFRRRGLLLGRHTLRVRHLDDQQINIDALRVDTPASEPDVQPWELLAQTGKTSDDVARAAQIRQLMLLLDAHTCNLPVEEKAELCTQGLGIATTIEEKREVIKYMAGISSPAAVKLLAPYLSDALLKDDVASTILQVARMLPVAESETLKPLPKQAFEVRNGPYAEKYAGWAGSWLLAGPYLQAGKTGQELFEVAFQPEQPESRGVIWRPVPDAYTISFDPRAIDLLQALGGEQRVAYLRCQVYSPVKQSVSLESAADDGSKVWLNGKLVLSCPTFRLLDWPEHVSVTLEQGWNSVLVKVMQLTGGWSEGLHIMPDKDQPYQAVQFKAE